MSEHRERFQRPPKHRGDVVAIMSDALLPRFGRTPRRVTRYQARCRCGWEGLEWPTMVEARKDGKTHVDGADEYEREILHR